MGGRRDWVWACLILTCVFWMSGCSARESADEKLKKIADDKEARLKELFAGKGSELRDYKGTVSEETDIQKKIDYPFIGEIAFSYTITKPEGEAHIQYLSKATAHYRYSKNEGKWEYQGCSGDRGSPKPEEDIVQFRDVQQVFQK